MKYYSTVTVAREIGVDKQTLLRWLWAGKLAEPRKRHHNGGVDVRLWSERELKAARAYKEANYGKGRGGYRRKASLEGKKR